MCVCVCVCARARVRDVCTPFHSCPYISVLALLFLSLSPSLCPCLRLYLSCLSFFASYKSVFCTLSLKAYKCYCVITPCNHSTNLEFDLSLTPTQLSSSPPSHTPHPPHSPVRSAFWLFFLRVSLLCVLKRKEKKGKEKERQTFFFPSAHAILSATRPSSREERQELFCFPRPESK